MEDTSIGMYVDYTGQRIVGEILEDNNDIVKLKNPLLVMETRPSNNDKAINLIFGPEMHIFDIKEIEVKWCRKYKVNEQIHDAYIKFMERVSAARLGIEITDSIPNFNK